MFFLVSVCQYGRGAAVRDVINYWPEWLIHLLLVAVHTAFTFGLHVPGCPRYVHQLLVNLRVTLAGGWGGGGGGVRDK